MRARNRQRTRGVIQTYGETPTAIPGLKSWWDSRTDAWMTFSTGAQISAWVSRAGSLGTISWVQATSGNQPTRATSVATFGSKNAVLFDGTDDFLTIDNANALTYLHSGTGWGRFVVFRMDSTGGTNQQVYNGITSQFEVGVYSRFTATPNGTFLVGNNSASFVNNWTVPGTYCARDVTKWQAFGYITGTHSTAVSGNSATNADIAAPTSANPTRAQLLGARFGPSEPLKGYIAQVIDYDHPLTTAEKSLLATWAAAIYGVSA